MDAQKNPVFLIFGYPLNFRHFGGLVWIQNIADCIEKTQILRVRKVSNDVNSTSRYMHRLVHIRAVIQGFLTNPNIAMIDTYGEASFSMWILLRLFKPATRIVTVFHHYESLGTRHRNSGLLTIMYCKFIDYLTKLMLRNSNNILTVSLSSSRQLHDQVRISDNDKIVVVGCSDSINMPSWVSEAPKDIDFLCIGRIEKFEGLEEIWNFIRKNVPSSKFVLAGRASAGEILWLRNIGIDHRGIVSEEEKLKLYSRAKVFIFPSLFEGFGLAVTEAIAAGLSIIAWKLPVFEERFGKEGSNHLRLVEIGETSKFAQESLLAMRKYKEARDRKDEYKKSVKITWDDIGKSVSLLLGRLQ